MTDVAWLGVWLGVLTAGVGAIVMARALGLAATHARDALHVGAGVWVLGWPEWQHPIVPIAIALVVTIAVALVPLAARIAPAAARLRDTVTGDDERWTGLTHYALAYTALTAVAAAGHAFTAAVGLLALSLGDGLGGAVGRRFGRWRYRLPWSKPKSIEGSLVVALGAALGALAAARWFAHALSPAHALAIGAIAALVEAAAPRSTDNLLVPVAAWTAAELLT